jgi:hypothetical protein
LDYFGANIAVFMREPAGRRHSLLSANFCNFQQTILSPKAPSMSFVLQHGEAKKVSVFIDSYSDLTKQHLVHTSHQIIRSFPVPTKTNGFFFATSNGAKKPSLVRKIKKSLSLSKQTSGFEADLPHVLEGSYASLLQVLSPEIAFEDFFLTKLASKPHHSILPSILVPYEVNCLPFSSLETDL